MQNMKCAIPVVRTIQAWRYTKHKPRLNKHEEDRRIVTDTESKQSKRCEVE